MNILLQAIQNVKKTEFEDFVEWKHVIEQFSHSVKHSLKQLKHLPLPVFKSNLLSVLPALQQLVFLHPSFFPILQNHNQFFMFQQSKIWFIYIKAMIYKQEDMTKKMVKELEKISFTDAAQPVIDIELAVNYVKQQKIKQAQQLLNYALAKIEERESKQPENIQYYKQLKGICYYNLSKISKGVFRSIFKNNSMQLLARSNLSFNIRTTNFKLKKYKMLQNKKQLTKTLTKYTVNKAPELVLQFKKILKVLPEKIHRKGVVYVYKVNQQQGLVEFEYDKKKVKCRLKLKGLGWDQFQAGIKTIEQIGKNNLQIHMKHILSIRYQCFIMLQKYR